jgi:serine/threonine protein kinase
MPEDPLLDLPLNRDPAATTDESLAAVDRAGGVGIPAGVSNPAARYRLGEEIARGGMGAVYRAADTMLGREVAVKVLQEKYAPDSGTARRFADEAHITGQLQHPNVPAVHDLGVLPDGRPFLAMKLIKGRTLAALLGERPDPAADRGRFVAIFEHACQAVAYAHSLRVIHRDLKLSNVMVGKFGEVQVMDWGLAKVLPEGGPAGGRSGREPPADDGTVIRTRRAGTPDTPGGSGSPTPPTRTGSVLGTPAYMAPEQAGGEVDRLDSRCDVFGLGAVLCEVLTGKPPYVGRDEDQIYRKAMGAILADAHARLNACGAEPELVALCLRCLAPEPDDRPRDAGAVAVVVAALRAAAEERARRAELDQVRAAEQGKRRRVLLAASGAVVVVLLAGLGASLWQTRRALQAEAAANANAYQARAERDARDLALAAEQRAHRDEAKARKQAFDALRTMTAEVVERKFAQGAVLTEDDRAFLRGVIAQFDAFAAIKVEDADSRAVRAEGRFRVGNMRARLGEVQQAAQDFDEALSIRKQLVADFPTRPEFRQDLAWSHNNRGILFRDAGRLPEAEKEDDQALSLRKQLAADFPSRPEFRQELAMSHNNRGLLLRATGRLREAEKDHDQALSIYKQLVADFPTRSELRQELATSFNNRGALLRPTGRLREAEEDYDQALSLRKQLAADFPARPEFRKDLAISHNNRGNLLLATGRPRQAEEDYGEALSIFKQLAVDFPGRPAFREGLAHAHNSRGVLLRDTGRLREAEEDFNQALSLRRQLSADFTNQPGLRNDLAGACLNLAILHQRQGNWTAAKRLLLEGRPHHLTALKANSRHPGYREFYRRHLAVLTAAYAGLLEPGEAVRTAETSRDLSWDAPGDAYDAACSLSLCVPIVAKHDKLDATQREEAAQFYGVAAMKLLREAVNKGFKDVAHIKQDTDLDPLRQRDDFRKLVAELEGKGK